MVFKEGVSRSVSHAGLPLGSQPAYLWGDVKKPRQQGILSGLLLAGGKRGGCSICIPGGLTNPLYCLEKHLSIPQGGVTVNFFILFCSILTSCTKRTHNGFVPVASWQGKTTSYRPSDPEFRDHVATGVHLFPTTHTR